MRTDGHLVILLHFYALSTEGIMETTSGVIYRFLYEEILSYVFAMVDTCGGPTSVKEQVVK